MHLRMPVSPEERFLLILTYLKIGGTTESLMFQFQIHESALFIESVEFTELKLHKFIEPAKLITLAISVCKLCTNDFTLNISPR